MSSFWSSRSYGSGSSGWSGGGDGEDGDEHDEEDEADEDDETRWLNKDSVLFAIDCTEGMTAAMADGGTSAFCSALQCASSMLQDKIISSDSDLVGVLFFGTKSTFNPSNFDGIYSLQELDVPDARRIVELDKLAKDGADFASRVGHGAKVASMANVFWTCLNMFSRSAVKFGSRRVFLFTNDDSPHGHDIRAAQAATTRAKDLAEQHVEIELFNMNKPGQTFSMDFYKDVVSAEDDEAPAEFPAPTDKLSELLDRVRRREYKKRMLTSLSFGLTETMEIAVRLYNLIGETKKSAYTWLNSRDNSEARAVTKYMTQGTGFVVSAKEMKPSYTFGGEQIIFERDELTKVRTVGPKGLVLMGFKPRALVKRKHQLKKAAFIYPNDKDVVGSSAVFFALLQRLAASDKVAICRLIPRDEAAPRLVALVPQLERLDDKNVQIAPPGFHVIYLPFNDDLRKLKRTEGPPAEEAEIKLARKVVERLELKNFSVRDYENPAIQRFYAHLQAVALDRDVPEDVQDYTAPPVAKMVARAGNELKALATAVFPGDYNPAAAGAAPARARAPAKRKIEPREGQEPGDEAAGARGKRQNTGDDAGDAPVLTREAAARMVADGTVQIASLTVPELKAFLQSQGAPASARRKADLLAAIEHLLRVSAI